MSSRSDVDNSDIFGDLQRGAKLHERAFEMGLDRRLGDANKSATSLRLHSNPCTSTTTIRCNSLRDAIACRSPGSTIGPSDGPESHTAKASAVASYPCAVRRDKGAT
jgi:hypothetical protein